MYYLARFLYYKEPIIDVADMDFTTGLDAIEADSCVHSLTLASVRADSTMLRADMTNPRRTMPLRGSGGGW